jgi:hypothetical protein
VVYVTVQLPLVDVRPLLADATHRDPLPHFPLPDRVYSRASADHHRSNFVRGLGALRPRLQGGAPPWLSESYYVDVAGQLRVARQRGEAAHRDGRYVTATPVYRNFYTDGVAGRVEVCFRVLGPRGEPPYRPDKAWRLVVTAPARLRDDGNPPGPVIGAGPAFARHLLRATTTGGGSPESWWVRAGTPAIITEIPAGEQSSWHRTLDQRLVHQWVKSSGVRASAWEMTQGTGFAEEFRRLRVHLSRLHADFVTMQVVLGLIQSGQLDPAYPPAERYVAQTLGLLLRPARHGYSQSELLTEALQHSTDAHADTLASLEYLADAAGSPALAGLADRLTEALAPTGPDNIQRAVINVRELVMTKYEPHVQGGTFNGPVNFGSGGAHQRIGPSADELAPLVEQLFAAFDQVRFQLPDEQRYKADHAIDDISEESGKDPGKRSKTRLLARLDSLLTLASTIGGAGEALGHAVTAIRAAFGF